MYISYLGCEEDGGLFHAVLARVDSNGSGDLSPADQDEDEEDDDEYDNEDAQTVIYKSPFSSPGRVSRILFIEHLNPLRCRFGP